MPLLFLSACGDTGAQEQVLDSKTHHLRWGTKQEWNEFPVRADKNRLTLHFNFRVNMEYCTISLRQYDVSRSWQVKLNGFSLGTLTQDEKDMFTHLSVPRGYLKTENNELIIEPEETFDSSSNSSDDIRVGQIVLSDRSVNSILNESDISIEVYDTKARKLIPSRIHIVNINGALQRPGVETGDTISARTGILYTGTGRAHFGLRAGAYKIYAGRGFEYGVDSTLLTVNRGDRVQKKLYIQREVIPEGWISCDPHVHTFTYSGHGDASVTDRVLTIAGEGIDFPIVTDHNVAVDIGQLADKMHMAAHFTPVIGNEVTTSVGHFNIFPLPTGTSGTNYKATDWNAVSESIRATPGVKAIILNHARDIHNGFRPYDAKYHIAIAGMDLRGWSFPANAMEILNSGSQQTDPRQLYFDWFGMMNRGHLLTPVGSSDSHDVGRYMVGQARTYIRQSNPGNPGKIDSNEVIRNFVAGKVSVSFGLLTEMSVNNMYGPGDLVPASDKIAVTIKVWGPQWISANRIILYANGQKIREATIPKSMPGGIKWKGSWLLPRPRHDVFLVAIAEGPGINRPFWPIAKPFQHESPDWKPLVIGATGAVWIDADNDKKRTCAYDYAKTLWTSTKQDIPLFLQRLSSYDESVAVQAAAVLKENGTDLNGTEFSKALKKAPVKTKINIERFINEMQLSTRSK
jgi:hypothetical protein